MNKILEDDFIKIISFLDRMSSQHDIHLTKHSSILSKDDCTSLIETYLNEEFSEIIIRACLKSHPDFYTLSIKDRSNIYMGIQATLIKGNG